MEFTFDTYTSIIFITIIISFLVAIVGFFILFNLRFGSPANPSKSLTRGLILFLQVFVIGFMAIGIQNKFVKQAKEEFLSYVASESFTLAIDEERLAKADEQTLLQIFQTVESFSREGSYTNEGIRIALHANGETTHVILKRDAQDKDLYWTYWDRYGFTMDNSIGQIKSDKIQAFFKPKPKKPGPLDW